MKPLFFLLIMVISALAVTPPQQPYTRLPDDILRTLKEHPGFYSTPHHVFPTLARKRSDQTAKTNGSDQRTAVLPVLCAGYSDHDSNLFDPDTLQQKLFGNWPSGSMRDFYLKNSYGQFEVTGKVFDWIDLSHDAAYYDRENQHTGELLTELFTKLDSGVDFSQFDNDGRDNIPNSGDDDGYVDVVFVVHSGPGAEETGGPEIWSQFSRYSYYTGEEFLTNDTGINGKTIRIDDFIIVPARQNENLVEIGVFCHEFGHSLGLPDLYDHDNSSSGVGTWCIMSDGAWGGNRHSPQTPTHFSAWCKERLGWVDPVVIKANSSEIVLPPVENDPVVYKLWAHGDFDHINYENHLGFSQVVDREYFLLENRQATGYDTNLPGTGLLIWHIDHTVPDQMGNDNEYSKLVDLEAADGRNDLDIAVNDGDAGDPYPGNTGNSLFDSHSNPNSLANDLSVSKVAVRRIHQDESNIIADLHVIASDFGFDSYDIVGKSSLNNILEPGDYNSFYVKLLNLGFKVEKVTGILSSPDEWVTVTDSMATWGFMAENGTASCTNDPFKVKVSPDSPVHSIPFVLDVTGTDGITIRLTFQIVMEKEKILLVDDSGDQVDDKGTPILNYYTNALDQASHVQYDIWSVQQKMNPTRYEMWVYDMVIWFTGSKVYTLSWNEMANFRNIMYLGGNVLLCGQYFGQHLMFEQDEMYRNFYQDWMHARFPGNEVNIQDSVGLYISGIPGNSLSDGIVDLPVTITNGDTPSMVEPDSLAWPVFRYHSANEEIGTAGICYDQDYQLVYMSLGLESIGSEQDGDAERARVMSSILDWFQSRSDVSSEIEQESETIPSDFKLFDNFPNPFNGGTTIYYQLFEPAHITLSIYDVTGRLVCILQETRQQQGSFNIHWSGEDNLGNKVASGIYFYQLRTPDRVEIKKMALIK